MMRVTFEKLLFGSSVFGPAILVLVLALSAPVVAQQSEETSDTATIQENDKTADVRSQSEGASEEAEEDQDSQDIRPNSKKAAKQTSAKRSPYLGPKIALPKQRGPAARKPISILPQPYVPVGSVKPTDASVSDTAVGPDTALGPDSATDDEAAMQAGKVLSDSDSISDGRPERASAGSSEDPFAAVMPPSDGDPLGVDAQNQVLPPQIGEQGRQTLGADTSVPDTFAGNSIEGEGLSDDPFEASSLGLIDPSLLSLPDFGATTTGDLPESLYGTYDRDGVIASLNQLADRAEGIALSPVLDGFYRKLVRRGIPLEPAADLPPQEALIGARLRLAARLGDGDAYRALLSLADGEQPIPGLARARADDYLLSSRYADVCVLSNQQRQQDADPYWVYLAAFCAAAEGNRASVDFQFGILEELTSVPLAFYALMDQILLEAEAAAGGMRASEKSSLSEPLVIRPLDVAMARLSGVEIEAVRFTGEHPLSVVQALTLPNLSSSARADLVGQAVKRGLIKPNDLVRFFRTANSDLNTAIAEASLDDFSVDAALGQAALTGDDGDSRIAAAATLWHRAIENGTAPLIALALNEGLSDIAPSARYGANLAALIRIALMAGDDDRANALFTTMRASVAGNNLLADQALLDIAPLAVATGLATADLLSPERLQSLVEGHGLAAAIALLSVMESLEVAPVSDAQWALLATTDRLDIKPVNPILWRRFLVAAHSGDLSAILIATESLLAALGRGAADPALLGSMAAILHGLGAESGALQTLAQGLMREQLLLRGL